MNADRSNPKRSFWVSWTGIAPCAFIAIAATVLSIEHRAHVWQWLPFALLLACPLMHLFHGHGGHGEHSARDGHGGAQGNNDKESAS